MHKRGVAIALAFAITVNTLPLGAVKVFADEIITQQETSQEQTTTEEVIEEKKEEVIEEVVEEQEEIKQEEKATIEVTRNLSSKVNIENGQYGTVEGINSGETINLQTHYTNVKTNFLGSTGEIVEKDNPVELSIKAKNGYKWSYDKTAAISINSYIDTTEEKMTINPINSTSWNKNLNLNLSGSINITFEKKSDAQEITTSLTGPGAITPKEDNLYFDQTAQSYTIDKDSKHTFILTPEEGYKVGKATLITEQGQQPVQVQNNEITIGAGQLQVEFVEDIPVVETFDINVNIQGNGTVSIGEETLESSKKVTLTKEEQVFKVTPKEGNYIESVQLNNKKLTGINGYYTIPANTDNSELEIVFAEKIDTQIVFDSLKVPYTGEDQTLKYNVVEIGADKDAEPIATGSVIFYGKNWLGQTVQITPKEVGTYNFTVEYNGDDKYNSSSVNDVFEIYDAREMPNIEIEGIGNLSEIDTIQLPYNNTKQELKYNVLDKNGEILYTGTASITKDIFGVAIPIDAKDVGTYNAKFTFAGNEEYQKIEITKDFEITKFKPSVKVSNTSAKYTGSSIKTPVSVTHNAGYITLYTGVDLNLSGRVNIDLNLGDGLISQAITSIINSINIGTMGDLKEALKNNAELLAGLGINIDDVLSVIDYLPDNLKVETKAPKDAGAYIATAVVLDQNAEIAVGIGSLLITRNNNKVVFTEDSLQDKGVVYYKQDGSHVDSYTHQAVFEGTTDAAKIIYTGVQLDGKTYHSQTKPSAPGVYIATAYSYKDPAYTMGLAARSFTIIKEYKGVEFTKESLPDKAVIKVNDSYSHEAIISGTETPATIRYTGITLSGEKYCKNEQPTEAGTYIATAYSPDDTDYITGLGVRSFTIIREQKNVEFTEDSLKDKAVVKVNTDYSHTAVYKDTNKEAKLIYTGIDKNGKLYFSKEKPTTEGIYAVAAYSYNDPEYREALAVRTFSIAKYTTQIDIISEDTKTYNGKSYELNSIVKDKNGEIVENANVTYTYYKGKEKLETAPHEIGDYTVVATFSGDESHIKSVAIKNFSIVKADLIINIDNVSKLEFEEDPTFTYTVEGLADGETVEFELVREEGEAPGKTYEITVVDKELENYNYTVNPGTLTIEHKPADEGFGPDGDVTPEVDGPILDGSGDDDYLVDEPASEGEGPLGPVMPEVTPEKDNNNNNNSSDNPKTGDTGVLGYAGIALASLLGIVTNKRKRK